jgi:hypothetical protein
MWGQHSARNWSEATGGEHLERLFWQNVKCGNWNDLERHLSATFVSVTPEGTLDRAATIERLKHLQLKDFLLSDLEVHPNGNDMVVTYTISLQGTFAGRGLSSRMCDVTVWQHAAHGWMAIMHAETVAP